MAILNVADSGQEALLNVLTDILPHLEDEPGRTNLWHWVEVLNCIDEALKKLIEQLKLVNIQSEDQKFCRDISMEG